MGDTEATAQLVQLDGVRHDRRGARRTRIVASGELQRGSSDPMRIELDDFNDCNRPYMAAGDAMWGGMAVVISPNVPKEHIADELVPVMPSRWYCRLYRLCTGRNPLPRRFRAGRKIERDQVLIAANKMFVSPEMWKELQRKLDRRLG